MKCPKCEAPMTIWVHQIEGTFYSCKPCGLDWLEKDEVYELWMKRLREENAELKTAYKVLCQAERVDNEQYKRMQDKVARLDAALKFFEDIDNWLYCNPLPVRAGEIPRWQSIKWVNDEDPMPLAKAARSEK